MGAGEEVVITRRGQPVAKLVAEAAAENGTAGPRVDWSEAIRDWAQALEDLPAYDGNLMAELREEERF